MAVDQYIAQAAKDKAEALFSKGKYAEALSTYEKISLVGDKDPRVYLRMGDIARKIQQGEVAIGHYSKAVDCFARLGFAIKAIAVCKIIIGMDPAQKEIQIKLAKLCGSQEGAHHVPVYTPVTRPAWKKDEPSQKDSAPGQKGGAPDELPIEPVMDIPKAPLFSDLSGDEFVEVVRLVRTKELAPGAYLFEEGAEGDSIYIVVSGEVEIVGRTQGASPVVLSTLKDGDFFGEFAFFSRSRRTSGVRSTKGATLLELTRTDMEEIIGRHPRVEQVLLKFYKERVVERLMAICEVFSPMSAGDRKEILSRVAMASYYKDETIVKEGERGDTMYLIREGRVLVWIDNANGEKTRLTELKEGDFFGEIALATSKPRVASVTAITDVVLVAFSRPMIKDILAKYPAVRETLQRIIKERVVDAIKAKEPPHGMLV